LTLLSALPAARASLRQQHERSDRRRAPQAHSARHGIGDASQGNEEVLMRVTFVAACSLVAGAALAQMAPGGSDIQRIQPQSGLSSVDQKFVNEAAQANLAATQLGELGVKKGSTAKVRDLSQMIIDDHKKLGERLRTLSMIEKFTLPPEPNAQQKATYDRLSTLSGSQFDRALLDQLKIDHQQAISLFQNEAQSGTDPQLKSFAELTVPSLQHHQQMVAREANRL
jgi:putative membrane protein